MLGLVWCSWCRVGFRFCFAVLIYALEFGVCYIANLLVGVCFGWLVCFSLDFVLILVCACYLVLLYGWFDLVGFWSLGFLSLFWVCFVGFAFQALFCEFVLWFLTLAAGLLGLKMTVVLSGILLGTLCLWFAEVLV